MHEEWLGPALLGGIFLLFVLFMILAFAKARRRRRAEFQETQAEALEAKAEEDRLLRETEEAAEPARLREEPEAPVAEPTAERELEVPEIAPPAKAKAQEDQALKDGLQKTSSSFLGRLQQIFSRSPKVDPKTLDDLEEALLTADVGVGLSTRFIDDLRGALKAGKLDSVEAVQETLKSNMLTALKHANSTGDALALNGNAPRVILFVGVNGVGKTTTIGKIAQLCQERGHKVVLAAGDTFRAAAAEQLTVWGERTQSRVIRGEAGVDPASVVFNAVEHAKQTSADIVLADTAGRLHTKTELMDEIKKVKRSLGKARAGAPDETWLVVDATTGQNALQQAKEFNAVLGLSGVILTKLDGTAKGGVVVAIADALKIPVRFVGVGEKAADLRPFDADAFLSAMFQG